MNKLIQALETIAAWDSHTTELARDYGSNGVRDFYRQVARKALAQPQPTAYYTQPAIHYSVLYDYAQTNKLNYNELCTVVRTACGIKE